MAPGTGLIADRRLLLTADKSRIVEADDPDGAFLFSNPGMLISGDDVARYGLELGSGDKIVQKNPPPALPPEAMSEAGAIEAAVKDRLKADNEVMIQETVKAVLQDAADQLGEVEVPKAGEQKAGKSKAQQNAEAEHGLAVRNMAQNIAPAISRQALLDRGDPVRGGPDVPKNEDEGKESERTHKEAAKEAKKSGG
jgi:hypothetical protein